jgi:hypothetical protein
MILVVPYFWSHLMIFILMQNENYLLLIVLPYLVSLGLSRFNVQTNVRFNIFKSIKSMSHSDPDSKMLFESCNDMCEMTYCTKANLKKDVMHLLF